MMKCKTCVAGDAHSYSEAELKEAVRLSLEATLVEKETHEKHADNKTWCFYCGINAARQRQKEKIDSVLNGEGV